MIQIVRTIMSKTYLLLIVILISCTGGTKKRQKQEVSQSDTLTEEVTSRKENNIVQTITGTNQQLTGKLQQCAMTKEDIAKTKDIDLNKIYEQSEVVRAICPLSDSQTIDFLCENFKYPDIEPMIGKGDAALTIERDGTISDVVIINSIHPAVDKEFIRIFKLFPKFIPGKINGIPVRSKYITRISSNTN